MRSVAILAISVVAALTPALAFADPGQAQTPPAEVAQPADSPAVAPQSAPAAVASTSDPKLDEVVCRSGDTTTGTRLGASRECHSIRQWNERRAQSQKDLQKTQAMGLQGFSGSAAGAKGH